MFIGQSKHVIISIKSDESAHKNPICSLDIGGMFK